jgi:hypothetical protein
MGAMPPVGWCCHVLHPGPNQSRLCRITSLLHGELLMFGFEVAQSTVSKYMVQGGSPSQSWKTFFRNHAQAIAVFGTHNFATTEPPLGT